MADNTAIAVKEAPPAPKPARTGTKFLEAFTPTNVEEAFRLSKALSMAGDMVPKHFQGKPEAVMAAMLHGASIGMPPMQALQYIAVINGRASVWGDALPGLVMAAGHFVDVEMEGEGGGRTAVATLTRKDGRKIVRRFSWADAEHAGLSKKPGPWQQYPDRMLQMRARAWAVRDGAPDALVGLAVADEVRDYGPDTARDVTPAPRPGRSVYIEDAPPAPVDEIHETEVIAADDEAAERLESLTRTIIADMEAGGADAALQFYAEQIDDIRAKVPALHAKIMEAAENGK